MQPILPSYEAYLLGFSGFCAFAFVSYTLTVMVIKPNDVPNMEEVPDHLALTA